jgi:hypothetical protein
VRERTSLAPQKFRTLARGYIELSKRCIGAHKYFSSRSFECGEDNASITAYYGKVASFVPFYTQHNNDDDDDLNGDYDSARDDAGLQRAESRV